jgi:soluble P-type ATPase
MARQAFQGRVSAACACPFSAVPDLLRRVREAGLRIAVASSAKKDEIESTSTSRALPTWWTGRLLPTTPRIQPAPDIFKTVLRKLKLKGADAVAIGDAPYDAAAVAEAKIATIGVLCGGSRRGSLRQAGCAETYPKQPRCSFASRTPACEVDKTADRMGCSLPMRPRHRWWRCRLNTVAVAGDGEIAAGAADGGVQA